jgi:hypothetical protein
MKILLSVFFILTILNPAPERDFLPGRQERIVIDRTWNTGGLPLLQEQIFISGTVTERGTGFPARGVIVRWKGTSHSVVTGWEGSYRIEALPESRKLVFSKPGWKERSVRVRFRRRVDISLVRKKLPVLPGQPEEDLPPDSLLTAFN